MRVRVVMAEVMMAGVVMSEGGGEGGCEGEGECEGECGGGG